MILELIFMDTGERLNAFWTVFSLDRCWAVVLRCPTIMSDDEIAGSRIDNPWPLDMESYEMVSTPTVSDTEANMLISRIRDRSTRTFAQAGRYTSFSVVLIRVGLGKTSLFSLS